MIYLIVFAIVALKVFVAVSYSRDQGYGPRDFQIRRVTTLPLIGSSRFPFSHERLCWISLLGWTFEFCVGRLGAVPKPTADRKRPMPEVNPATADDEEGRRRLEEDLRHRSEVALGRQYLTQPLMPAGDD